MKILRLLLLVTLCAFCMVLVSCSSDMGEETVSGSADWGEEVVYVRLTNGETAYDWIVRADGDMMRPAANFGAEEFDFSDCRTGDVLRMEIELIQELFPANAVYSKCEKTGKTADVNMKDEYKNWMTEMNDPDLTIAE